MHKNSNFILVSYTVIGYQTALQTFRACMSLNIKKNCVVREREIEYPSEEARLRVPDNSGNGCSGGQGSQEMPLPNATALCTLHN